MSAADERLRRKARKARGLCQQCGRLPAMPPITLCAPCAAGNRRAVARLYERRTSGYCCRRCGEPVAERSRVYCLEHARQQRAYDKAWRERRAEA